MKLDQALIALGAGKMIRDVFWKKGEYIYIKDNQFFDEAGKYVSSVWLASQGPNDEYELYEHPKEIWVNEYHGSNSIHLTVDSANNLASPGVIRKAVKYREVRD